ncbi:zinc transporter ZIP9 isoform X3 [Scophthalmus maximus]|nr:zinc transporter ZIP9 isoform X3 [Scophthalmus maximus]
MFVIDQIGNHISMRDQTDQLHNSVGVTATLGLVIHAAGTYTAKYLLHIFTYLFFLPKVNRMLQGIPDHTQGKFPTKRWSCSSPHVTQHVIPRVFYVSTDGFALGAAVATGQVTVQVIVFFAVILHKAPTAFALVTFLMHAGLERKYIQGHLLAFSAASPIVAITTYFILHASGSSPQNQLSSTGMGMLFSAGTFLYVATVHVLPEVSSSRTSRPSSDLQQHTGAETHQQRYLGLLESLTLILGVGLPMVLSLGLRDD